MPLHRHCFVHFHVFLFAVLFSTGHVYCTAATAVRGSAYFEHKIIPNTYLADLLGQEVSISAGGLYGATSAMMDTDDENNIACGSVSVFSRASESGEWIVQTKLFPPKPVFKSAFGSSLFMGATGSHLLIGAIRDSPSESVNQARGAAYVFVRSGHEWNFQRKLVIPGFEKMNYNPFFGNSVVMDGSCRLALVSAFQYVHLGVDSGAVFVFRRTATNEWVFLQGLVSEKRASKDLFGIHMDITSNGRNVVISAYGADIEHRITVFSRPDDDSLFVRQAILTPSDVEIQKQYRYSYFGIRVAINDDGNRVFVGNPEYSKFTPKAGIYVFTRSTDNKWIQDIPIILPRDPKSMTEFGKYLSASADGNYLVVALHAHMSEEVASTGAVYTYQWTDSNQFVFEARLDSSDADSSDGADVNFGYSASVSGDGNSMLVGAPGGAKQLYVVYGLDRCQEGYYCPNTVTSIECSDKGSYCPIGSSALQWCPNGSYCPTPASRVSCRLGSYCPSGSTVEADCPAGSYCTASSRIATCRIGSYCPARSIVEIDCPAGSYCTHAATIAACQSGSYCPLRSTEEADCPAGSACSDPKHMKHCAMGSYCPSRSTVEHDCPAGSYCGDTMSRVVCRLGSFCPARSTTEKDCPSGSYCADSQTILPCSKGSYCPLRSTSPAACPAGSVCADPSVIDECPIGYYCPAGSTVGVECALEGSYCPLGSSSQEPCPKGSFCMDTSTRKLCTVGSYCPEGSVVEQSCPAGSVCSDPSVITVCQTGSYCPEGSSSESPCRLGSVCANPSSCQDCTAGSYCPLGSAQEVDCPAGYVCETPSVRVACLPGSYCPLRTTVERSCPEGNICKTPGEMKLCEAGYFCPARTSDTPVECPQGSYCPSGSGGFVECPIGTYNPSVGMGHPDACLDCPRGFFGAEKGLSVCASCGLGMYSNTSGASSADICKECQAGTYNPSFGQAVCVECPPGRFGEQLGAQDISACQACGWYYACPVSGMSKEDRVKCDALERANPTGTACSIPCPRCIGGGENGHGCIGGFTSRDCQSCPDNHYDTKDQCIKCKPLWMSFLSVGAVIFLVYLGLRLTRNNVVHRTLFLIIVNFLVLSIIMFVLLAVEKPRIMSLFLEYMSIIGFYADFGSPGCFGHWNQHHRFLLVISVFGIGMVSMILAERRLPRWMHILESYNVANPEKQIRRSDAEKGSHSSESQYSHRLRSTSPLSSLRSSSGSSIGFGDGVSKEKDMHKKRSDANNAHIPMDVFAKGCKNAWLLDYKRTFHALRDTILMMVYPSMLGYCLSVISCRADALVADPSISCRGNPSYTIIALVGGVCFLILALVIPIHVSRLVYNLLHRWEMDEMAHMSSRRVSESHVTQVCADADASGLSLKSVRVSESGIWNWFKVLMAWYEGHCVNKYVLWKRRHCEYNRMSKPVMDLLQEYRYPFFAVWNMFRKAAMVLMLVISTHANVQLGAILSICILHMCLLLWYMPFKHMSLHDKPSRFDLGNHTEIFFTFLLMIIILSFLVFEPNMAALIGVLSVAIPLLLTSMILIMLSFKSAVKSRGAGQQYKWVKPEGESKIQYEQMGKAGCVVCKETTFAAETDGKWITCSRDWEPDRAVQRTDVYFPANPHVTSEDALEPNTAENNHTSLLLATKPRAMKLGEFQWIVRCVLDDILLSTLDAFMDRLVRHVRCFRPVFLASFIPQNLEPRNVDMREYADSAQWWHEVMYRPIRKHCIPECWVSPNRLDVHDNADVSNDCVCVWCRVQIKEVELQSEWTFALDMAMKNNGGSHGEAWNTNSTHRNEQRSNVRDVVNLFKLLKRVLALRTRVGVSFRRYLHFQYLTAVKGHSYFQLEMDELLLLESLLAQWIDIRHTVYIGVGLDPVRWPLAPESVNQSSSSAFYGQEMDGLEMEVWSH